MIAAMRLPTMQAPTYTATGRASARRRSVSARICQTRRAAKNSVVMAIAWNDDSGCPPKNVSATAAASPAPTSGPGRRMASSARISSQGMSGKMLVSGHASQITKNVPNAKTSPVSSAPPKRMPKSRPSWKAPKAPRKSLRAAINPSDHQKGST